MRSLYARFVLWLIRPAIELACERALAVARLERLRKATKKLRREQKAQAKAGLEFTSALCQELRSKTLAPCVTSPSGVDCLRSSPASSPVQPERAKQSPPDPVSAEPRLGAAP